MLGRPAHVIADEQIQQAIPVIIKQHRGSAEALTTEQAARPRDVHKSSFAGVAKNPVLPHAGDENVRKPVVVVIADGYTHSVHLEVETGAFSYVSKSTVAIVVVKLQRGALAFVSGPVHAVDE